MPLPVPALLGLWPLAAPAAVLVVFWLVLVRELGVTVAEATRLASASDLIRALEAAARDGRPPGYELVLMLWAPLWGGSEVGARALSLAWGLVAVAATFALARTLSPGLPPVLAPLLLVGSPLALMGAAGIAPDAQAIALGAVATWQLFVPKTQRRQWVGYGIPLGLALFTDPAALALVIGHGLALASLWLAGPSPEAGTSPDARREAALAVGEPGAAGGRIPLVGWVVAAASAALPLVLWAVARLAAPPPPAEPDWLGQPDPPLWPLGPLGIGALALVGALSLPGAVSPPVARAALVFAPWLALEAPVGLLGASGRAPGLAAPLLALALGGGLFWVGRAVIGLRGLRWPPARVRAIQAGLAFGAAALVLPASAPSLAAAVGARPQYRPLVGQVRDWAREPDLLVAAIPGQLPAIEFYNQGRLPVVELPFGPTFLEGTAELALTSLTSAHRALWTVTAAGPHDPANRVEAWLAARLYFLDDFPHGGVRLARYYSEPDMRSGQSRSVFGGVLELPEAAVPAGVHPRDFPIPVRLHWRAREPISSRLVMQVELVGDGSRVLARHASEPAAGTRPTPTWEVGETVVDRVAMPVPDTVPSGTYMIRALVYEAGSRTRLKLADGRETLDIGTVRLGPATRGPR